MTKPMPRPTASPATVTDRRAHPRYPVLAEAVWSAGRQEGRCRIHTLSRGGAEISEIRIPLHPGDLLHVTILEGGCALGTAAVEVLRASEGGLALYFLRLYGDLATELDALFAELTPLG